MSIIATVSNVDVILKINASGQYLLERKEQTAGVWLQWDGSSWVASPGGISTLDLTNFTDYGLSEGVYQYRYTVDAGVNYITSNCVVIGENPVGWTFGNYEVPDGQFGEILTPDDIRYSFLWGVQFTASDGTPWTDEQTRAAVEWATYQLGKTLNLTIYPIQVYADDDVNDAIEEVPQQVEKLFPYSAKRKRNFLIRLKHRPVQEVTRFDWYDPISSKIASLMDWKRLDRKKGLLWFYPKQGNLQTFLPYAYPWNIMLTGQNYLEAFHVDYLAGYKNAAFVPKDLQEIIGKIAALKLLNAIGDGLIAGFSSSSLSLDGMSESFSSTQSATSIGGNMWVRTENGVQKIKKLYRNRKRFSGTKVPCINPDTNKFEMKECSTVLKHNALKKKCYRITVKSLTGEKHSIEITEDHSLFTPLMKPLEGKDIKVGDWIRMGLDSEPKMIVCKVKRIFRVFMYDLSVMDYENFVASNFVSHNSAYFGARIKVYTDDIDRYIGANKHKHGNFYIGSL